jgi:OOP family OmpA-OmpF porin
MPGYYIETYDVKEFDSDTFNRDDIGLGRYKAEGRKTYIRYWIQEGSAPPSNLQIIRNYQNALKAVGAVTTWQSPYNLHAKLERGGSSVWVKVGISDPRCYMLTIVEEQSMQQQVQANAEAWMSDIRTTGHAAVYGIYFDTNQAALKPESDPALKEIAALMEKNPALRVHLVGHTDNQGDFAYNMKLSEARAAAVMNALTTRYKVNAARLRASGIGPLAPVAPNRTEEGKAKNRRVELVEQ